MSTWIEISAVGALAVGGFFLWATHTNDPVDNYLARMERFTAKYASKAQTITRHEAKQCMADLKDLTAEGHRLKARGLDAKDVTSDQRQRIVDVAPKLASIGLVCGFRSAL
jgi:hypothetical protein